MDELECEKCAYDYEELEQVVFIDPIPYRDEDTYLQLKNWRESVANLRKRESLCNKYEKIQEINQTIQLLEEQLKSLLNEWNYEGCD